MAELHPDSDFNSCFRCPKCNEFFTVPVYQCDNGHSICDGCSLKSSRCLTCRANVSRKLRNYHLEHQLLSIDCVCKFPGCGQRVKMTNRLQHEEECQHKNLNCLIQNCKWLGHRQALLSHLIGKHKIPHYEVYGNSAEYSSRLRSTTLPANAGCVKLLHTFYLTENQPYTVLTYIFMDSQKNLFFPQFRSLEDAPLRFTLKIWNTESQEPDEVVVSGNATNVKFSLDEERDSKACVALDLESLIRKFAFPDKLEQGHSLLHYRLTVQLKA